MKDKETEDLIQCISNNHCFAPLQLSNLVEQCQWPDPSVELQVWSRLTYLAYKSKNHSLVMRCAAKAMAFDAVPIKHRRLDE